MKALRAYIKAMKQILTTATLALCLATPALAEDTGTSLMERGARMFLEGIMREVEPAMKDLKGLTDEFKPALRSFVTEMGPALGDLLEKIEDFSVYHPPEILPNGDIIMRKKTPKELENADEDGTGEIET